MTKGKDIVRGFNDIKNWGRNFIDLLIRRLCRKNHGDEQMKRVFVVKFNAGIGVLGVKKAEKFVGLGFC